MIVISDWAKYLSLGIAIGGAFSLAVSTLTIKRELEPKIMRLSVQLAQYKAHEEACQQLLRLKNIQEAKR